jgi:hypothetical protein
MKLSFLGPLERRAAAYPIDDIDVVNFDWAPLSVIRRGLEVWPIWRVETDDDLHLMLLSAIRL